MSLSAGPFSVNVWQNRVGATGCNVTAVALAAVRVSPPKLRAHRKYCGGTDRVEAELVGGTT